MDNKILIVTLISNFNYGNRLQAIAMNKIVSDFGYKPVFFNYKLVNLQDDIKEDLKRILGFLGIRKYKKSYYKGIRERRIKKEVDSELEYTNETIVNFKGLNKIDLKKYSAVIAGSDQIWHKWTTYENELDCFYLSFIDQNKRIAFAASFGFDAFPQNDLMRHKEGISGIQYISCREELGCKLVKSITGKEAISVLDPTLCIEPDYWKSYAKKPNIDIPSDYVFLFFLGKMDKWRKEIEEFSRRTGLMIIDMQSLSTAQMWKMTPSNFLWLIKNASVVLTDSFHCVVFSIIYHVQFKVFHRSSVGFENMFDRISTLLEITGLENSEYKSGEINSPKSDYKETDKILTEYRNQSIEWLQNSINKVLLTN